MLISDLNSDSSTCGLLVRVKVKRAFFSFEWIDTKVLYFSPEVMLIKTDERFDMGETISLSMKYNCPPSPIVIDIFYAKVISKTKECSCFLYRLNLSCSDTKQNPDIILKQLHQIELIILKKKALLEKRNSINNIMYAGNQ